MDPEAFAHHLASPCGRDHVPVCAHTGTAGGAACGDLVRIDLRVDSAHVAGAGFSAAGCGAAHAAGSAAVALVRGRPLLDAARVGVHEIAEELGGLSPGKLHAADLAADALHRALGAAARASAAVKGTEGRVLVAMSGGVDSAVAALRSGPRAVTVTLELWRDPEGDPEGSCCSASAVRRARALAHGLGLPHLTFDLREEFRAHVVEPWVAGYAAGETPNPCVACNGHVRLDAMLDLADRLGCGGGLVTGHYARLAETADPRGPLLRTARDAAKDQTYMLAALAPASLARLRFPLGELTKPEVRALAAEAGLPVAAQPDSQDLCFLTGVGRERFLARFIAPRPGALTRDGAPIGVHAGQHAFTVGQRKGLGVAAPEPLYVLAKHGDEVRLGTRGELETTRVPIRDLTLRREPERVRAARLRYHGKAIPAGLEGDALALREPAPGAAPGQLACLLDGELVVGWATIDSAPG